MSERSPEKCSGMFQHVDVLLEAYKYFSDFGWFSYDDNFCQKLSVFPLLKWGVKDVGLWLNLMGPPKPVQRSATNETSLRKGTWLGDLCYSQ